MLKKLTLAFALFFSIPFAHASHLEGGELRYEFNGTDYTIYLKLWDQCNTTPFLPTADVFFKSTSCNDTFTEQLSLVGVDIISNMWCPGTTTTCGSSFSTMRCATYTTTVSLQACNDWKMTFTHSALESSLENVPNPGSQYLVLTATLDNSVAINRSAYIANDPPFYASTNSWNTIPFQATDADGDNITYALEYLTNQYGTNIAWETGYTNSNQLGTFTAFFGNNLVMYPNQTGVFMMNSRIKEFRNGVEVGSYQRAWTTRITGNPDPAIPLPAPGTSFNTYTTCAGQTNTITLNFDDSVGTDSVYADFLAPTIPGFTFTTSSAPGIGSGSATISWTTPGTVNPNTTPYIVIPVLVTDNHCPNAGYAYYSVIVEVIQCNPDSVWPGDANADYTADMYDPLAIAVAYGTTGTVRPGATITWQAEYCPGWSTSFNSGLNHKHADCNGDGTIDNGDLAAITANYGMVHLRPAVAAKSTADPDLYFDLTGIVFAPGATVTVPIKLGTSTLPISNFYGLATNIDLQGITLTNAPTLDYTTSWLGNTSNTMTFTNNASNNNFDWVYARRDQQAVASGNGTIATMTFTIPAGAADGTPIEFYFNGTRLIDENGADIPDFNAVDDTAYVTAVSVPSATASTVSAVIVPNPSKNVVQIQVTTPANEAATVVVTDIAGRIIHKQTITLVKGNQSISLPTVAPGMYEVRIQSQSFTGSKALKWVQL